MRTAKLYINDGSGSFAEKSGTPFKGALNGSISFADVDGDNDEDVLITGWSTSGDISKLYLNDEVVSTSYKKYKTEQGITAFPNPCHLNTIRINYAVNKSGQLWIKLFDLNGRLINQKYTRAKLGDHQLNLDVSELDRGIYFIEFHDGITMKSGKFVKL